MTYTYEFTTADGRSCCKSDKLENLCEHCRAAAMRVAEDYNILDPYAEGLKQLRAASSTPEHRFAEEWKAGRLAELDAEHAMWDADVPAEEGR